MSKAKAPVVNFAGSEANTKLPTVRIADREVGEMAAKHLHDLNVKHFAFWTNLTNDVAVKRNEGFVAGLKKRGIDQSAIHFLQTPFDMNQKVQNKLLRKWLSDLPKPVGVFGWADAFAHYISNLAYEMGLAIPNEIALLGVDDDPFICPLTHPPLSSIRLPGYQVGVRSVQLLADLMDGKKTPAGQITLSPIGVITRGSTDMLAIDDRNAIAAIKLIRKRATDGLTMDQLVDSVSISRRSLERKFREIYSRSPAQEIRQIWIQHAKSLLIDTNLTMADVAEQSGFGGAIQFSRLFKQLEGIAPANWRRLHRPAGLNV